MKTKRSRVPLLFKNEMQAHCFSPKIGLWRIDWAWSSTLIACSISTHKWGLPIALSHKHPCIQLDPNSDTRLMLLFTLRSQSKGSNPSNRKKSSLAGFYHQYQYNWTLNTLSYLRTPILMQSVHKKIHHVKGNPMLMSRGHDHSWNWHVCKARPHEWRLWFPWGKKRSRSRQAKDGAPLGK